MENNFEKLPPNLLIPELLTRKQSLEHAISCIKQELSMAPSGKLWTSTCNHTVQYYQKSDETENSRKYIPKTNQKLIKSLAQKDYNEKILPNLELELYHLNITLNYLQKNQIANVYQELSANRRQFVNPITLPDKQFAENWLALEYPHKSFNENAPTLSTAKGERVRSKSEVIIADTLFRMGIPYRYEFPVKLQKFTVHPDFYCLNLRTHKEYAWEHLGMMDAQEYATSAVEKMAAYENAGFFPGDNLIISMETSASPLSSKKVEKIARNYLI